MSRFWWPKHSNTPLRETLKRRKKYIMENTYTSGISGTIQPLCICICICILVLRARQILPLKWDNVSIFPFFIAPLRAFWNKSTVSSQQLRKQHGTFAGNLGDRPLPLQPRHDRASPGLHTIKATRQENGSQSFFFNMTHLFF